MSARPEERTMWRLRLAVVATLVAVLLAFALLLEETAYLFTAFMFLGPALLVAAVILLGWSILEELRSKKVL